MNPQRDLDSQSVSQTLHLNPLFPRRLQVDIGGSHHCQDTDVISLRPMFSLAGPSWQMLHVQVRNTAPRKKVGRKPGCSATQVAGPSHAALCATQSRLEIGVRHCLTVRLEVWRLFSRNEAVPPFWMPLQKTKDAGIIIVWDPLSRLSPCYDL